MITQTEAVQPRAPLPGRLVVAGGALLARERPTGAYRRGRLEPAPAGKLVLLAAGCRLLTDALLDVGRDYAGLATLTATHCGLDPADPEAHVEEPAGAPPPGVGTRHAGQDALILPPGASGRLHAAEVPAVRIEIAATCLLDLLDAERRSAAGPVALLLAEGAVSRLLVATLSHDAGDVPLLTYLGLDHLHGQLRVLARLRPARVLAEPAAAEVARRAGLAARSIYEGPGRCLLVHPLERALARGVLGRLAAVAHAGHGEPAAEADTIRPAAGAAGRTHGGLEPIRDMLALRSTRRFVLVPTASISYISSRGGLVTAYTDAGTFWTDAPLGAVEGRLDPRRFLRLDASRLVNLARVAELLPWTHQRYRLRLADAAETELVLSRDVGRRLRARLGW